MKAVADGIGGHSPTWDVGCCSGHDPKESKMRSNSVKTCAAGALLFGGALGAAQPASAGLVWKDSCSYNSGSYNYDTFSWDAPSPITRSNSLWMSVQGPRNFNGTAGGPLSTSVSETGYATLGAYSVSINPVFGPVDTYFVSKTATTESGFSASMQYAPASSSSFSCASFSLTQGFEVTAGTSVDIVLTKSMGWLQLAKVVDMSDVAPGYETYQSVFGLSVQYMPGSQASLTLTEGKYLFQYQTGLDSTTGGSFSGTVIDFAVVPAPGAVALLGAAGLMGRRRRN